MTVETIAGPMQTCNLSGCLLLKLCFKIKEPCGPITVNSELGLFLPGFLPFAQRIFHTASSKCLNLKETNLDVQRRVCMHPMIHTGDQRNRGIWSQSLSCRCLWEHRHCEFFSNILFFYQNIIMKKNNFIYQQTIFTLHLFKKEQNIVIFYQNSRLWTLQRK